MHKYYCSFAETNITSCQLQYKQSQNMYKWLTYVLHEQKHKMDRGDNSHFEPYRYIWSTCKSKCKTNLLKIIDKIVKSKIIYLFLQKKE